jgi:hypothetical protein
MPVSSKVVTTQIVFVVAAGGRVAARFAQHPQPQVVAVGLQPRHLLEHRRARHVEHAADDDTPRFAGRMQVNGDRRQRFNKRTY